MPNQVVQVAKSEFHLNPLTSWLQPVCRLASFSDSRDRKLIVRSVAWGGAENKVYLKFWDWFEIGLKNRKKLTHLFKLNTDVEYVFFKEGIRASCSHDNKEIRMHAENADGHSWVIHALIRHLPDKQDEFCAHVTNVFFLNMIYPIFQLKLYWSQGGTKNWTKAKLSV